jgi:serine/threonine protein kinase
MTSPALVGTVLDGKFRIERALASGACGDVYEAVHLGLGSPVAVKVLRPGFPETEHVRRKRFVREARVAARIQSDHVVRVFDIVAPDEGLLYIVMELLQGETLAERIRRVGAMSPAEAVGYMLQAAKPLAQMHDEGIVHRDVKPSNVFLARDAEGNERIKLLDFGVAALQQPVARARGDSAITFTDAMIGTPRYMAPEQVRDSKQVDARADVWALGVTLYELLAGTPAFDGQTVLAVLNQIEHQEPRPLAERQPGIAVELAKAVHRCLAKDPALRPPDARAFAAALAPFSAEAPARRPSDPVDLSLSDENVEVVRGARPRATRAKMAAVSAAVAIGVIALLFLVTRRTAVARVDDAPAATSTESAGAVAPPSSTTAPASQLASAASAASSLVTIEPMHDDPPHRVLDNPKPAPPHARAPRPPAHGTAKPATRPEDDDRLE